MPPTTALSMMNARHEGDGHCAERRARIRPRREAGHLSKQARCRANNRRRGATPRCAIAADGWFRLRPCVMLAIAPVASMKGEYQSGFVAGDGSDALAASGRRGEAAGAGFDWADFRACAANASSISSNSAGEDPSMHRPIPIVVETASLTLSLRCRAERCVVDVTGKISPGRHTGQSGSGDSRVSRKRRASASKCSRRPVSGAPRPRTSLIASVACSRPITPGNTPSTPASAQLGAASGGGGSGNRQR